jgi:regulator of sigma E protease
MLNNVAVVAVIPALALLIAVHEYGHYRMAVACGVKVLRFSIGFGKVLLRWRSSKSSTEFVVCAFPVGGYVRMLDERESSVPADERHLAFNTQPLRSRVAIVASGPIANLMLAVLLYAIVNWSGVEQAKAILASPLAGSVAQRAGVTAGDLVQRAGFQGDELQDIESFEELQWLLTRGALEVRDVRLALGVVGRSTSREVVLKLSEVETRQADAQLLRTIGIVGPLTRPVMGEIVSGGAADRAGLRQGDLVLAVGSKVATDGQQLRDLIRTSLTQGVPVSSLWRVNRSGTVLELSVTPDVRQEDGAAVGRIGAYVGSPPELVLVRYGFVDGLWRGATRTWDVSVLTLRMMGKMVMGEASIKNLSGPLTIADYAGKSASMGLVSYLVFLALISVSLGVLNLLPVPVLDGGHLLYYLYEGLTGRSVSDAWMERLQRGGVAVLLMLMSIALFNDVSRLFG